METTPATSSHNPDTLVRFGDRTSSFITTYEGFRSFATDSIDGEIRYAVAGTSWVAATEPLASPELRAQLFMNFARSARSQKNHALIFPISAELARAIQREGGDAVAIGQEPLFDLARYFREGNPAPGRRLRPELSVAELTGEDLSSARTRMEALATQWKQLKRGPELLFLNRVNPFRSSDQKRYFAATDPNGKLLAFLTAVPVAQPGTWYFAEVVREPTSRAGTMEKLMLESMRLLAQSGAREVRLGLCAATGIEADPDSRARALVRLARVFSGLYNFSGVRSFKEKLMPTRWETLYAASDRKLGLWALSATARVHLGDQAIRIALHEVLSRFLGRVLRPEVLTRRLQYPVATLSAFTLFSALHLVRHAWAPAQNWFETSAYRPGEVTLSGVLFHPLLHTTPYHFLGNVLSLLFFGAIAETFLKRRAYLGALAFGLWASNPLSHALVLPLLTAFDPRALAHFLTEWDYGSSNGVYALVGAFATLLRAPRTVLIPFIANGWFLCIALQSWLSFHHLVGLLGGYLITARASRR